MDLPSIEKVCCIISPILQFRGNTVHMSLSYISPAYAYDNVTAS